MDNKNATFQSNVEPRYRPAAWLVFPLCASSVCRLVFTLAILGSCGWLVFFRGESPWWFLFAVFLLRYRRVL